MGGRCSKKECIIFLNVHPFFIFPLLAYFVELLATNFCLYFSAVIEIFLNEGSDPKGLIYLGIYFLVSKCSIIPHDISTFTFQKHSSILLSYIYRRVHLHLLHANCKKHNECNSRYTCFVTRIYLPKMFAIC